MNCSRPATAQTTLTQRFAWGLAASVLAWGSLAVAQTIYVTRGKSGSTAYTDQPSANAKTKALTGTSAASTPAPLLALPFELRQLVNQYPVILYSASQCQPCDAGRALLLGRGVVFVEKTVNTVHDSQALQNLTGASALPLLSIGAQKITGYSKLEWTQFLDAAGYPKSSVLPSSYHQPAATPLTSVPPAAASEAGASAPESGALIQTTPLPAPSGNAINPANPAGIQF